MTENTAECVYVVERKNDDVLCKGIVERTAAERDGIRHLTVIIVPFVADGDNKGSWIVHNRHDKQTAKNKKCPSLSVNLFGGHCSPSDGIHVRFGESVKPELLFDNAIREMSEELFFRCTSQEAGAFAMENWSKGFPDASLPVYGKQYAMNEKALIPIGYADYSSKSNVECSYLYALPVPSSEISSLIAADDYERKDGTKGTISLPILVKSERELYEMSMSDNPDIEICDAITRLWERDNNVVYQKLLDLILNY